MAPRAFTDRLNPLMWQGTAEAEALARDGQAPPDLPPLSALMLEIADGRAEEKSSAAG